MTAIDTPAATRSHAAPQRIAFTGLVAHAAMTRCDVQAPAYGPA